MSGPSLLRLLMPLLALLALLAQGALAGEAKVTVSLDGAFALGHSEAPLTLVEYTDYECGFCRRFHLGAFEQLKREFIDTGKLRYVNRDFPLERNPNALPAAQAARCAGRQGRFWEMRHLLIANGDRLNAESMLGFADDLRLDAARFRACLDGDEALEAIERDLAEGAALGIGGTPAFVLGRSAGASVEGVLIVGAQPYAVFEARIRELLGGAR